MKKGIIIVGSLLAATAIGVVLYRKFVPPYFKIMHIDFGDKSGEYVFGSVDNHFNFGESATIQGRNGWTVKMTGGDITKFDLYNNSKLVKTLTTIDFKKQISY